MKTSLVSVILALLVFTVTCSDDLPTEPGTLTLSTSASTSISRTISEELTFKPVLTSPGQSTLAPSATVSGSYFRLDIEQNFTSGVLQLEMTVTNISSDELWRPLRLELLRTKPTSMSGPRGDNGIQGRGAIWDYGQSAPSSRLTSGEGTAGRQLIVNVKANSAASLNSLELTFRVSAVVNPTPIPTIHRSFTEAEAEQGYAPDVIEIRYHSDALTSEDLAGINLRYGLIGQDYQSGADIHFAYTHATTVDQARRIVNDLRQDPQVDEASLFEVYSLTALDIPPATEVSDAVALGRFPQAWRADEIDGRTPGQGIVVGILDSGISDAGGELLRFMGIAIDGRINPLDPLCPRGRPSPPNDPIDHIGHGTAVAAIIGSSPNDGRIVGAAYGAQILSIKIGDDRRVNEGYVRCGLSRVRNLQEEGAKIDVLNLSWSFHPEQHDEDQLSTDLLLHEIRDAGTLIVAGTGNDFGSTLPRWPAASQAVVSVGGTNPDGRSRCAICNYFEGLHVVAPAEILSLSPDGTLELFGYTSAAAPQVAALAAILKARNPGLTPDALTNLITQQYTIDIGNPGYDEETGHGRIVAARYNLRIEPQDLEVEVGEEIELKAIIRDEFDNEVDPPPELRWYTGDSSILELLPESNTVARFRALRAGGPVLVTVETVDGGAAAGEKAAATVDVIASTEPKCSAVTVEPNSATITLNALRQFTATARDAGGNILTGAAVTWSSSDPDIATVDVAGLVTGLRSGSATITAACDGVSGTTLVTVMPIDDSIDFRVSWSIALDDFREWSDASGENLRHFVIDINGSADIDFDAHGAPEQVVALTVSGVTTLREENDLVLDCPGGPVVSYSRRYEQMIHSAPDLLKSIQINEERDDSIGKWVIEDPFERFNGAYPTAGVSQRRSEAFGYDCDPRFQGPSITEIDPFPIISRIFPLPFSLGDIPADNASGTSFSKTVVIPYFAAYQSFITWQIRIERNPQSPIIPIANAAGS